VLFVDALLQISSSLWYRLSVLLNFLPTESDLAKIGKSYNNYYTVRSDCWSSCVNIYDILLVIQSALFACILSKICFNDRPSLKQI